MRDEVFELGSCRGSDVSSKISHDGNYIIVLWCYVIYTVVCCILEQKREGKGPNSVTTGSFASQQSVPPELLNEDGKDKCEQLYT